MAFFGSSNLTGAEVRQNEDQGRIFAQAIVCLTAGYQHVKIQRVFLSLTHYACVGHRYHTSHSGQRYKNSPSLPSYVATTKELPLMLAAGAHLHRSHPQSLHNPKLRYHQGSRELRSTAPRYQSTFTMKQEQKHT